MKIRKENMEDENMIKKLMRDVDDEIKWVEEKEKKE